MLWRRRRCRLGCQLSTAPQPCSRIAGDETPDEHVIAAVRYEQALVATVLPGEERGPEQQFSLLHRGKKLKFVLQLWQAEGTLLDSLR